VTRPNVYPYNTTVRLTGTFTVSGSATDPTTIKLRVKTPAAVITEYLYSLAELTRSSAGVYYKDIQLTQVGNWWYRFEGTGTVAAHYKNYLKVETEW
jgi:hypothetical protein